MSGSLAGIQKFACQILFLLRRQVYYQPFPNPHNAASVQKWPSWKIRFHWLVCRKYVLHLNGHRFSWKLNTDSMEQAYALKIASRIPFWEISFTCNENILFSYSWQQQLLRSVKRNRALHVFCFPSKDTFLHPKTAMQSESVIYLPLVIKFSKIFILFILFILFISQDSWIWQLLSAFLREMTKKIYFFWLFLKLLWIYGV